MENVESSSLTKKILVGTGASLVSAMALILVFAFCLRFFGMGEGAITVIVQIIKGVSVLLGVMIALKKHKEMGFLSGTLIGIMFTALSFLVFSVLDGFRFEFDITVLTDLVFGAVIGAICGVIAVNIKK